MRRMLVLSLLAAAVPAALSGCASAPVNPYANVDTLQVARVENAAKTVGVQVYWLNFPTKPSAQVN